MKSEELSEKDKGLIGFLMREKHGTPFEHNFFRFHIKAPIFVAREWFRHRIGWSYNEYSGRYSEMPKEAYMPLPEQIRTQVGKPGAYTFEPMEDWSAQMALKAIEAARPVNIIGVALVKVSAKAFFDPNAPFINS